MCLCRSLLKTVIGAFKIVNIPIMFSGLQNCVGTLTPLYSSNPGSLPFFEATVPMKLSLSGQTLFSRRRKKMLVHGSAWCNWEHYQELNLCKRRFFPFTGPGAGIGMWT